mmetsp:Transcript_220/g.859  ORF Transcript_220/g.859 Transcript_220/m.859 type:complete len:236 (-) Transcript_220:746-1453(-)
MIRLRRPRRRSRPKSIPCRRTARGGTGCHSRRRCVTWTWRSCRRCAARTARRPSRHCRALGCIVATATRGARPGAQTGCRRDARRNSLRTGDALVPRCGNRPVAARNAGRGGSPAAAAATTRSRCCGREQGPWKRSGGRRRRRHRRLGGRPLRRRRWWSEAPAATPRCQTPPSWGGGARGRFRAAVAASRGSAAGAGPRQPARPTEAASRGARRLRAPRRATGCRRGSPRSSGNG